MDLCQRLNVTSQIATGLKIRELEQRLAELRERRNRLEVEAIHLGLSLDACWAQVEAAIPQEPAPWE